MNSTYLVHHGILGQKWGIRRFQNKDGSLTAAGKERYRKSFRLAGKIHDKSVSIEPKITSDVTNAIIKSGSKVYGLNNKLKTRESLARKIYKDSKEKGISVDNSAKNISDAIRYTSITDDKNFVSGYNSVKKILSDSNYTEVKCKNYFDLYRQGKAKHKQVTSVFSDKDGNLFEIQFQTPSSIKAKELKTPLYEEVRKVEISEKRKNEIIKDMEKLANTVKNPEGVYTILSHNNHGEIKIKLSHTENICNDELYHHGIKGQKWCVKNGPPYPLGASDHSSSERKAGWRVSLKRKL